MKKNWIIITIIITVAVGLGAFTYKSYIKNNNTENMIKNDKNKYDASVEIKDALNLLSSKKQAEIITNAKTSSNIVALSFEGISDANTMGKIVQLLQ